MKYIVAYDGGGTKTHIAVYDINGNCYFEKIGSGSNYTSCGPTKFISVVGGLYQDALLALELETTDILYVSLGLSGADLEEDYRIINDLCIEIFQETKFNVVNDAWIIMRSGLKESHGAVAISGTGTNAAAINRNGSKAIMRSLGFTTGTYGGGLDIAREGLHYAFRSEELTYQKTLLEIEIPKLFGKETMNELVGYFYPEDIVPKKQFGAITGIVNDCALKGDFVSNQILAKIGRTIAQNTIGVIKQVGLQDEAITVVIGGRVFDGVSPTLLDEFTNQINNELQATIKKPIYKPVVGAFLLALDALHIIQTTEIEEHLKKA